MDTVNVGKQIAKLRKAQGLTQKELAGKLHVTDGAVSKWERGINFPELSLLEPLAAMLGTNVIELLSLERATNHEVASVMSDLSMVERKRLAKELKITAFLKIVIELILAVALVIASKIFADHNIYGLAQCVTIGMIGFIGTLIGTELFLIRHIRML